MPEPERNFIRLTAPNPGPFTGDGTNTYLVGRRSLAVIDPGPLSALHLAAILAAAAGRPITHIILTHAHRDHADGIPALKAATGAQTAGMRRTDAMRARAGGQEDSPSGGDFIDWSFAPDILLGHGSVLSLDDGIVLEALLTPGHAPDHLCFALPGEVPVLFSGDHVMGWSTSVIAPPEGNMGDYLSSLELLVTRPEKLYLPGHGDAIPDGPRTARAYLLHRQMREQAVMGAIQEGRRTVAAIVEKVYEGLAPELLNAARLSVIAHLELLRDKGSVAFDAPLTSAQCIIVPKTD